MKTDTAKLKTVVNNLNKSIEELDMNFYNHDKIFNTINMSNIWEGISETACMEKYKELAAQYPYIIKALRNYTKSLNEIIKSYDNYENKVENVVENNF